MLYLKGECRGIIQTPERTNREGVTYPARYQVQIETLELVNGYEKVSLYALYGEAGQILPFASKKGEEVAIPVRVYANGRGVSFALADVPPSSGEAA